MLPIILILVYLSASSVQASFLPADCNKDGTVDVFDLVLVARALGFVGDSPYDLNGDGVVNLFDLVLVATDLLRTSGHDVGTAPETIFTMIAVEGGPDTTYDSVNDDSTVTVDVGSAGTDLTIVAAAHQGGADHGDVRMYLLFPDEVAAAITAGEITLGVKSFEVPGICFPFFGSLTAGTPTYYAWPLGGDHSEYTHYIEVKFTPGANLSDGWTLNPETDAPYDWGDLQAEESAVGQESYIELVLTVANSGETQFKMHVDSAGIPSQGESAWNPYSHDGTFYGTPSSENGRFEGSGTVPLIPEIAMPVGLGLIALVVWRRKA